METSKDLSMRIMVTGGHGLVGSAIQSIVDENFMDCKKQTKEWIFLNRIDGDLTEMDQCEKIFKLHQPTHVIHLAAKVGGLFANMNDNLGFYVDNSKINQNVLSCCHRFGVKKCVSCLSTCIFPDKTTYPIDETMVHNGPPHSSNEGYSYAKRMLEVLSRMYNQKGNCQFICVIPTNIFGPFDNFSESSSHVIPALIRKGFESLMNPQKDFVVFGSGLPRRQFIYSKDLAKLFYIVLTSTKPIPDNLMILSTSESDELSIKDVSYLITTLAGIDESRLFFDGSKSDGQFKKTANNNRLMNWLNDQNIDFEFTRFSDALELTWNWFCSVSY